jgi:dihydrodipicolinate synthase/N-acetylneuraminate lyase
MNRPPNLLPALVTPFTEDGTIDAAAHSFNVHTLWAQGVRGFLIGGSTGEGPYLDAGERTELVALARAELGDEAHLLCGVSGESTAQAVAQTAEAVAGGADGVLVMTPTTLIRGRDDLVFAHFREVAERSPLPLFVYTVPNVTGYSLPVETITELSRVEGIVGVKDSSGDPDRAGAVRAGVDEGFIIMIGSSRAIAATRARGADGAITASSNYAAALAQQVVDGEPGAQELLTTLVSIVEPNGIPGTKAAAEVMGLRAGWPRRPLRPVEEPVRREIAAGLARPG